MGLMGSKVVLWQEKWQKFLSPIDPGITRERACQVKVLEMKPLLCCSLPDKNYDQTVSAVFVEFFLSETRMS